MLIAYSDNKNKSPEEKTPIFTLIFLIAACACLELLQLNGQNAIIEIIRPSVMQLWNELYSDTTKFYCA